MRANTAARTRLSKLEGSRDVRVRKVMLVPPILPIGEWELLAVASQNELASLTREGVVEVKVVDADPMIHRNEQ